MGQQTLKAMSLVGLGLAGTSVGVLNFFHVAETYTPAGTLIIVSAVLGYLVFERRAIMSIIPSAASSDLYEVHRTRDGLYRAIISAMKNPKADEDKVILHVAIHGTGRRRTDDRRNDTLKEFDETMTACIRSTGSNGWKVRAVFGVASVERLDLIVNRLRTLEDAQRYEVKAFVMTSEVDPLSPLVVGQSFTTIAEDDKRNYRAAGGVVLRGRAAAAMYSDYFDGVWNKSEFFIRPASGLDEARAAELRALLPAT
ncbi:hypothetical protein [Streptomyces canus]|uniref:hypothetical protein n=1 Tax=Streptomyces canus TaxID=58343 RepID=UPI002DD88193|nr:hypothetical protein [Streptomyces canus]WSD82837.1 hypothetical protein OG925_00010 [Streptomyces canus]WSD91997.1 hypothetical protein OG925_50470 [Streptomyces canus]WSD92512.1 hypothetical protein OG925_50485 [Streptomyces canus]